MSKKSKKETAKKPWLRNKVNRTKQMNFLKALESTLGVVTPACRKTGVSTATHYRWLATDKNYAEAVQLIKNSAIDFAESALHRQISDGSTAATIFYLKCQGKERGYVERKEVDMTVSDSAEIIFEISDSLDEEE